MIEKGILTLGSGYVMCGFLVAVQSKRYLVIFCWLPHNTRKEFFLSGCYSSSVLFFDLLCFIFQCNALIRFFALLRSTKHWVLASAGAENFDWDDPAGT